MTINKAWNLRWAAPAKLNLMLNITGRRDDGYHFLQTVFQFVNWCDWLSFRERKDNKVSLAKPMLGVAASDNLIVRAVRALQQQVGCQRGVSITIEKHLPMGGGLGGGSSDAATTLVALNYLWELNLSVGQLMKLGLSLGVDVPIFIFGYNAWGEGVGANVQKITLPDSWFVIVKPDCHVETKAVFAAKYLTRNNKPIKMHDFLLGKQDNDCLQVVTELYRPVAKAIVALSKFGVARLTGTGACVFSQFSSKIEASRVAESLKKHGGCDVFLVSSVNRSPLYGHLDSFWVQT